MSTTTQPPTGTGNFFGLKQQADTAAKVYMDNVGRHDRRALPKEQESRDKMKEIQNRVNEHVRANPTKKDYPANKTIHSQRATMGNQKAAHRQRMQGGE